MKQLIICLVFMCFVSNFSYSQTKIRRAESSLKSDRSSSSDDDDDDDVGFFEGFFAEIFAEAFLYITYYALIESPSEVENVNSQAPITKYPYYNSSKGNYTYDFEEDFSVFRTNFLAAMFLKATP